ncbi:MAG: metallophosphoesterase [Clostridiales bacterium]|jgi:predicted MPP superfamily phosphohydrolase|nr:metallophosphoesterase [Clostridiales bacterium]
MNRRKRNIALSVFAAAAAGLCLYADNKRIDVQEIPVKLAGLPKAFNGFRIAHLSDLHLPNCACNPLKLAEIVKRIKPDAIALTGDLVDRFTYFDADGLSAVTKMLADIAPCFAVVGNHEVKSGVVPEWAGILKRSGVTVLSGKPTEVRRGEDRIIFWGLPDGNPFRLYRSGTEDDIEVVLSHYPENIQQYVSAGLRLVLTGHAHGGQWRFAGRGLISPGEGLFPKFTSGLYVVNNTKMIVSRGLRNGIPVRIFNSPHIPVVVLQKEYRSV